MVLAINAGGAKVTLDNIEYQFDRYAQGGTAHSTTDPISGTTADALYQAERYGSYTYEVPVTEGSYSVLMHFAEIYNESTGLRSFDVSVEDTKVLSEVDLYALAGHDGAYSYTADAITVNDGYLTITLETQVDNATLAGFAIFSSDGELAVEPLSWPDFFVGNITTNGQIRADFGDYWNQLTQENGGKWASVESERDIYDWTSIDQAYNYAKTNNIPFKQHTFVWGSQYPSWITELSASEQAEEIEEWIREYCLRYPETEMIDVVNEATPGHAPAAFAQNAFSDDWIIKSFQLARKYCPSSVLILNDYNVLIHNTDEFITMATPAVTAGVVDAIGIQAHGLADLPVEDLETNLNKIAALGLPIYISEYDIEKTNDQEQLEVMQTQFPVFYNHNSVVGITFWGYVVGSTWREGTGLINEDGSLRPAMTWLMDYIEQ